MLKHAVGLMIVAAACSGQTARVGAPDQRLSPGQPVVASLSLASAGQSIAAIQFDLQWDPSLVVQITPGEQLRAVSKTPYAVSLLPRSLRCVIAGLNQNAIGDGELLKLFVSANPNSTPGLVQVRISNLVATDPTGNDVAVSAAPLNVQLQNENGAASFPASAVLNAASSSAGPVSPGEIITILGVDAEPAVAVRIGGLPAPVLYAGHSQMNAIVPFGLDLSSAAGMDLVGSSRRFSLLLPVAATTPAIFPDTGTGLGQGSILNEDYTANSLDHPAQPGSVVMIYGTGFGILSSVATDGEIAADGNSTAAGVTATVAGSVAKVLYAGSAPGLITGVTQINVRLPADVVHSPAAPVILRVAGTNTPSGVTVTIQ